MVCLNDRGGRYAAEQLNEARRREQSATERLRLAWRVNRRTKRWVLLGWLCALCWFLICVARYLWLR